MILLYMCSQIAKFGVRKVGSSNQPTGFHCPEHLGTIPLAPILWHTGAEGTELVMGNMSTDLYLLAEQLNSGQSPGPSVCHLTDL